MRQAGLGSRPLLSWHVQQGPAHTRQWHNMKLCEVKAKQLHTHDTVQHITTQQQSQDPTTTAAELKATANRVSSFHIIVLPAFVTMTYARKDMASGSRWPAKRCSSVSGRCMSGNFSPAKRWFRMNMSVCCVVRGPECQQPYSNLPARAELGTRMTQP